MLNPVWPVSSFLQNSLTPDSTSQLPHLCIYSQTDKSCERESFSEKYKEMKEQLCNFST